MATASSSEDQISCCLCLDVFKKPRVLSCGHSFCTKCLEDYINKNYQSSDKQITCPYCMQDLQIPDSTKPVETWADQFPINIALEDSIKERQSSKISGKGGHISFLSSVCDNLKTFREILQSDMDEKIEKLRQNVDVNVVDTTEEVRRIGNTLISDFTATIHKEQDRLIKEIEKSQNFLHSEIEKMFTNHKHLIKENEKMIKRAEDLLQSQSESDIKVNIAKFTKLQNTTSEFLARSLSEIHKAEFKMHLRKYDEKKEMSIHIGEISTNIQTDTYIDRLADTLKEVYSTDTEMKQTDTQIDRLTETLKHTETINIKRQEDKTNPWLFSILVSDVDNNKVVVSDCNNRCVKCFCLERNSVINKHITFSPPRGLAESREQQDVVVALPHEKEILFLSLKNFKLIKTVKTDKQYFYISVLPGNRLAVTGYIGHYLDILTERGQLINSISADLIPRPSCLTVYDQCLIIVSKRENLNCLFCVTSSGDVEWESRDSARLKNLAGVTCDRDGNVFVCDCDRNCVVQLSRNGKVLRDILSRQDGLSKPWSVCCHGNKLYVGQRNTGQIKVFSWCKTLK